MITMRQKIQYYKQTQSNIILWLSVKMLLQLSIISIFTNSYTFCSPTKSIEFRVLDKPLQLNPAQDFNYLEMLRQKEKVRENMKFVLLWPNKFFPPLSKFEDKQRVFLRYNCPDINCYVTDNRNFFGGDLKRFDAIAFSGRVLKYLSYDLPKVRYNHQKYIYVNFESAAAYPICHKMFDNFFNWTYTYRLDSDLVYTYFHIYNMDDNIVGPKASMNWKYGSTINYEMESIWKRKKHAAAWIVSDCTTQNRREQLAEKIYYELKKANLTLDVYSKCHFNFRTLDCPTKSMVECWELIQKEYYFYLSFEASNSTDYVTDKVLHPLYNYTIPIVYGGADYSRFMPPSSYLDATKLSVENLVSKMVDVINSKKHFKEYFRWRSVYKYESARRHSICGLCSALHNETMMRTHTSHAHLREWWNQKDTDC